MVSPLMLYVEGGGDTSELKTKCREGFATFLKKANLSRMPRIVACGGRQNAYEVYCKAITQGIPALLLVDSEEAVASACEQGSKEKWLPWDHLAQRDQWARPQNSRDRDCHFMVQCMEHWFICDKQTLEQYFGQDFKAAKLPVVSKSVENIDKQKVYDGLKKATQGCKTKHVYGKGKHSFDILKRIDLEKVIIYSPWAERFVLELRHRLDAN